MINGLTRTDLAGLVQLVHRMATTHRRRALDAYYTPVGAVERLLTMMPAFRASLGDSPRLLEPCVGGGAFVQALTPHLPAETTWITNDLDPNVAAQTHWDASDPTNWWPLFAHGQTIDAVITNPPFNVAEKIAWAALDNQRIPWVIMLLRLSFLEPTISRRQLFRAHPPSYVFVTPRISFTGDGKTDNVTTAWMVWHKDHHGEYTHCAIDV